EKDTVVNIYLNTIPILNTTQHQLIVQKGRKNATFSTMIASTPMYTEHKNLDEGSKIDKELEHMNKMIPPKEFINQFRLDGEVNDLLFEMNGQIVEAKLFYWDYKTKIVISDVDGTITKSDALGPFAILLGMDYYRPGTAALYTAISDLGYKFIYITRKPMSQIKFVKNFLVKIRQKEEEEESTMPLGPVISTPYKNYPVLVYKIWRGPTVFKKSILTCLRNMFPFERNPWIAGFGDKPTDTEAYVFGGLDEERCFQIDDKGTVSIHTSNTSFQGYSGVRNAIDRWFPTIS
ncbi:hypothetical protein AKO1_008308, partial [Acrasis kona]